MTYQRIEHIAAGRFKVGKAQTNIFQAYLGTCLGVALYDKTTKIGGMIHILLPEPPSIGSPDFPEKYASTGVPMLIKDLVELGTSPENLEASIAGGALVGPVSQQDINLDIGGRSTDIVVSLLETSGIKTIKKWKHIHPLTGKKVAGVVLAWSPQSAARAMALGKTMNSIAHHRVAPSASSRTSSYDRRKLDHAGITGSGAEADEDAF